MNRAGLKERIGAIEESYEFFLAFAAQGVSGDAAARHDLQLREFLQITERAMSAVGDELGGLVELENLDPPEAYEPMIAVAREDARKAAAAVRLVQAQPAITSELIDNLNASIHVRALLTDLFLLDEVL